MYKINSNVYLNIEQREYILKNIFLYKMHCFKYNGDDTQNIHKFVIFIKKKNVAYSKLIYYLIHSPPTTKYKALSYQNTHMLFMKCLAYYFYLNLFFFFYVFNWVS